MQIESLRWLAELGVDRIATHGGNEKSNILDNLERLKEFNEISRHLKIMAGGGVTKVNFEKIVEMTGITEVHGTKIV